MQRNDELVHVRLWLALAGVVVAPAAPASAAAAPDRGWTPVDEAEPDRLRGGFGNDAGVKGSLGVERLVSISGNMVAHTNMGLPT